MPGTLNLEKSEIVQIVAEYAIEKNIPLGAICAAPSILGHAGLLEGRKATCFPGFEQELTGAEVTGAPVEVDGKLITARGAGCAVDFALALVELLDGKGEATAMRKGLQADERIPFEQLFFDKRYGDRLTVSSAGVYANALEMARWAPSAGNKQPWRAVVAGDAVHFYEEKSMRESPLGDIQRVDVGIALAHFDLTMREEGHGGRFVEADPGIALPENVHYIISYEREE